MAFRFRRPISVRGKASALRPSFVASFLSLHRNCQRLSRLEDWTDWTFLRGELNCPREVLIRALLLVKYRFPHCGPFVVPRRRTFGRIQSLTAAAHNAPPHSQVVS